MIRPESPFRGPEITMTTLAAAYARHGAAIELWLFGAQSDSQGFQALPQGFPWKNAGVIGTRRVAALLNQCDIFVDFSTHQAMGLTALEAMACGAAVIVPAEGGAVEFVHHGQNGLVVDTTAQQHCLAALEQLIVDHPARMRMQSRALVDAAQYVPERSAFRILEELFGPHGTSSGS
jgi:glycosyltransferase involved in cell wall biosynthesis